MLLGALGKNKTKTILFFAVPFYPLSTSIKFEYTRAHAHSTAYLEENYLGNINDSAAFAEITSSLFFKTETPRYFQHLYPPGKLHFHWLLNLNCMG